MTDDLLKVAVVGMAGRFPGADDIDAFWRLIVEGREAVERHRVEALIEEGVESSLARDPRYVPVSGALRNPFAFDSSLFAIAREDARWMDPQHRVFLEVAWQALEAAGVLRCSASRSIGVFAGCSEETYSSHHGASRGADLADALSRDLGAACDFLSTRVSYALDLRGPALTVRTACSTSLVALHLAVQSLLTGECDVALAGGAAVRNPVRRGHLHEPGGIYSHDGHCRPYDARASGIVSGDGVAAVVLKRLENAIADGDPIHAVVLGSAVSNDGRGKIGFTAPGLDGQVMAIANALHAAGLSPRDIGYVEGHGTATKLGDSIEVAAMTRAWRRSTSDVGFCTLGSVKSNIGHLDAAAGIAGFIKAVMALEHRTLPGTANFESPNPQLELERSPFLVRRESVPWECSGLRRAAVHSLGLGGVNAHVLLEEAPAFPTESRHGERVTLQLSARSDASLREYASALVERVAYGGLSLPRVEHTLRAARTRFSHRRVLVGRSVDDLRDQLSSWRDAEPAAEAPRVVFVFPGGGVHHVRMGEGLAATDAVHRGIVERTTRFLDRRLGHDTRRQMESDPHDWSAPVAFAWTVATSVASASALASRGVQAQAVLGHSLGELSAAAFAEVFSLEDALELAVVRGEIFERLGDAATMHVEAAAETIAPSLPEDLSIAVINSSASCVVSGPTAACSAFRAGLARLGIDARMLPIRGAAHSHLLTPYLDRFEQAVADVPRHFPRVPVFSNTTGRLADPSEIVTARYWSKHLRETVRFADCVSAASGSEVVFVDVGPSRTIGSVVRAASSGHARVVCVMRHPGEQRSDADVFAAGIGALWEHGVASELDGERSAEGRRVRLPVAPFERVECRLERRPASAGAPAPDRRVALWTTAWKPAPSARARVPRSASIIIHPELDIEPLVVKWSALGIDPVRVFRDDAIDDRSDLVVDARLLTDRSEEMVARVLARAVRARGPCVHRILTRGAFVVRGREPGAPALSALSSAALVASQESVGVRVVVTDLEDGDLAASERELRSEPRSSREHVALARRWEPVAAKLSGSGAGPELVRGGTYLLTGALGRFGRWVGRCIAREYGGTIVIVHRSPMPPRSRWDDPSAHDDGTRAAIESIRDMERYARVVLEQADVGDAVAMKAILERTTPLRGIIHCAGDIRSWASYGPADELARRGLRDALAMQHAPKLNAARVLTELVAHREDVEFVALFSSNSSALGGPGLLTYAAANAALDEHARSMHALGDTRWVSIGWDGWRLPGERRDASSALEEYALSGDEAFDALRAAIRSGEPHVVVSRGDFVARIDRWSSFDGLAAEESESAPDVGVSEDAGDIEHVVTKIWRAVLGSTRFDRNDDLFDLGGHSLMLMRIRSRIAAELRVELDIAALLNHRTVAKMVDLVRRERGTDASGNPEPPGESRSPSLDAEERDILSLLGDLQSSQE